MLLCGLRPVGFARSHAPVWLSCAGVGASSGRWASGGVWGESPCGVCLSEMSASPQVVPGLPSLALGPGIRAGTTGLAGARTTVVLRHSGWRPESRAKEGDVDAGTEV